MQRLLESFLNTPFELEQSAKKSYRHENGFSKIVLSSSPTHSLRLHIYWNDTGDNYQENVHNHRWDFSSCTLTGQLTQVFFEIISPEADDDPSAEKLKQYVYEPLKSPDKIGQNAQPQPSGTRYRTVFVEDKFLRKKGEVTIPEGFGYHLQKEELHRVKYGDNEICMTLVLYTPPYNSTCNLYTVHEQYGADEAEHSTKDYTFEGLEHDLRKAQELIHTDILV